MLKLISLFTLALFSLPSLASDQDYLQTHPHEKKIIKEAFQKSTLHEVGIIKVFDSSGAPVLILQGIEKNDYYPEMVEPLGQLIEQSKKTYLFTWHARKKFSTTQKILTAGIEGILLNNPHEDLTIIGYSAGGVIGTFALQALKPNLLKRIRFHTVASPYYGYNAPKLAYLAAPFVGIGAIEVGVGFAQKIKELAPKECTHWITTNCERDNHACPISGIYPQTGSKDEAQALPCGFKNIKRLDDESHFSVIHRVIKEVFKDASK